MCRKCGAGTRRRPPPRRRLGLVGNKGSAAAAGAGESARLGSARQLWGGQAQGHAAAQGTGYLEEEEEGRGGG